ncbi:MAG: hypothetical protein LBH18_07105, partial [Spirochaetaceae bacterium]|nr:hypothetical protein [Spirochaetaceae bacterium]
AGNERFDEIEELEEAESADDPAGEPADHPAEEPEELEEVDDPAEKLEELDGSVEPEERLEELEELEDPEDKPEELEELEELEDLEEPENSYAYETVAGGPYDVEEFEAVDEFGKGPYDVEEFEEVDPDPAPMSAKFAPSDLDDIDVENYQLNIDEMFEDFSDSPRPEFDSDNLRVYDPMSIYNAKTTDSLNSPSPNSPKPAAASARTQKKYKRAAKADGSHNEPKSSPELAAHDEQAQGKDEDAQESDDEDDDHKPQKTAARSEQSQKKDEGIPELDGEDDEPKPQKTAVQSEQSQEKNENIPESEGGNDETKVQKTAAPKTEDAAWLKLAGETAVMEPEDIWEELSEDIGEDAAKSAERPASLFSSEILEEDPYGSDAFKTTETDNTDYALENAEIVYGEFISLPAKTDDKSAPTAIAPKPALSADPLYNVEEFFEAEENAVITAPPPAAPYAANTSVVDNYTFELPGKGTDINEIAKKIEASEVSPEAHQEEANIKIDIASPFNELFSNDDTQEEPEAVRKPAAVRTKPETARKPAVIRIKPEAARKTAVVSNKPEIPQRYAAKLVKPETPQKPAAAKTKIETPRKPAAAVKAKPEAPRKPAVRAANAAAYPYQPFFQNSDELEYLESAGQEEEKSLIKKSRSGIDYINPTALKNAGVNVDPAMKNLVDSVLRH